MLKNKMLLIALSGFLLSASQAQAWNETTITRGVIAGALTKLVTYALVKGGDVSPNKAVLPGLLVGLAVVASSDEELQPEYRVRKGNKAEEFVVGAATWALLTLFMKDLQKN